MYLQIRKIYVVICVYIYIYNEKERSHEYERVKRSMWRGFNGRKGSKNYVIIV